MFEKELTRAEQLLDEWLIDYVDKHEKLPSMLYVSDDHELQSVIMYAAAARGLKYARTDKSKSYLT